MVGAPKRLAGDLRSRDPLDDADDGVLPCVATLLYSQVSLMGEVVWKWWTHVEVPLHQFLIIITTTTSIQ